MSGGTGVGGAGGMGGTGSGSASIYESDSDTAAHELLVAGMVLGEPKPVGNTGDLFVAVAPRGATTSFIDLLSPTYRHRQERPLRATGTATVSDAASFTALWDKHSVPNTEVYADVNVPSVTAVLNASEAAVDDKHGLPNWGDHRVVLRVQKTKAWEVWRQHEGLMDQETFAELIEDRLLDIVEPDGATMLELAQSFQATINSEFEQAQLLSGGARRFVFKETVAATAGERGNIEIPKEFELGLAPFEGSDAVRVTCRFRYRVASGHLKIGYVIDGPEQVERAAFDSIIEAIEEHIGSRVLRGTPTSTPS